MAEIELHVHLVVGIGEVVHPAGGVGEDVDDVGVEEVVRAAQRTHNVLATDVAFIVDVGGVLRNHDDLVGVHLRVGVTDTLGGVELILAEGSLGIVVNLVAVVELGHVQLLLARDGIHAVHALDGYFLILGGLAPGDGLLPVQVGRDGLAVLVLLNLVGLVATVGGIGKTFADDGVTHPIDKLFVLGIGDFRVVHPERFH